MAEPTSPAVERLRRTAGAFGLDWPDGESLADYRDLDDTVAWGAIERLRRCRDEQVRTLAARLWNRQPLKMLDISADFGQQGEPMGHALRRLQGFAQEKLGRTVFRDEASYTLYSGEGEAANEYKKVRVRTGQGVPQEITGFPDTVIGAALLKKSKMIRYYFLSLDDKEAAENAMRGR